MNESGKNSQINTIVVLAGVAAAIMAAGLLGKICCGPDRHPGTQKLRDVKDLIAQCQDTIKEMDRALGHMEPSHS